MYYDQGPPTDGKGPGCLDALVITRVVFELLFWPVAVMLLVLGDLAAVFYLFTVHPALALIPLGIAALGVWLLARWDQRRHNPLDPNGRDQGSPPN